MAIAVDATSSGTATIGTTVTVAHTCAANAFLVVVVGATDGVGTPSATYNSVSMTLVKSINDSGKMSSFMFVLSNPASGTHNIVLTKGSGNEFGVMGVSFTGAGGYSATGSGNGGNSDTSATLTTNTNRAIGYVVTGGAKNIAAAATYTGSGTEFANLSSASQLYMAAYTGFTGGSDVTETWTFSAAKWSLTGVEIYQPQPAGFFNLM